MASFQSIRDIYEFDKHMRLKIEKQFLQGRFGSVLYQLVAFTAFCSWIVYLGLTFYPEQYPNMMRDWFDVIDKVVAFMMLVVYLITLYVTMQRRVFLMSNESLLNLFIILPILLNDDLSRMSPFYIFTAISRYLRIVYFSEVIRKHNELGETDVERSINKIMMIVISCILVLAGLFMEIENS